LPSSISSGRSARPGKSQDNGQLCQGARVRARAALRARPRPSSSIAAKSSSSSPAISHRPSP
jgi:hypothetical protein